MPEDARNRFADDVFTYHSTKDRKVRISREGRFIMTVSGKQANDLIAKLDAAPDRVAVQHVLARATGNYRHGNEREGKR